MKRTFIGVFFWMKPRRKINFTTQYVLIFGALLLAANILLGIVLFNQSRAALRSMLEKNMLDITNTAAGLIDGDRLGAYTAEDKGGAFYNEVIRTLTVFQERVEIEFIYAVKQVGPEDFVFTIDPDPVSPGEYGEEIVYTPALGSAGAGIAAVDKAPEADRWGNFYSAYCPVLDSSGAVAGIIGVDFGAAWYAQQIRNLTVTVTIISVLTVLIGVTVIALITGRTRQRFRDLSAEIAELSADVDELTEVLVSNPGYAETVPASQPEPDAADGRDEISVLSGKIRSMESTMKRYLDYLHARVNTDGLTGVGNTAAYLERVRGIESSPDAPYAVAVFDIDLLKHINDVYGHAGGDMVIRAAATVIARVFGKENVYRIGGDEFLVITDAAPEAELEKMLRRVETSAAGFTMEDKRLDGQLSLSGGAAVHHVGEAGGVQKVFVRADEAMYVRKGEHHRRGTL